MKNKSNDSLRRLARSSYWQTIYNNAKEIGTIKLFENDCDFSAVQIIFLRWLNIYSALYTDLAFDEDYISEKVINNDILCDAYLKYKANKNKEKSNERKKEKKSSTFNINEKFEDGPPRIVFN